MSRGYDGYDIDDSRGSGSRSGRSGGRGSSSSVDAQMRLQALHRKENEADWLDRQQQERTDRERLPLAREQRVQGILYQRLRSTYADRDKTYSLRDSEIYALSEVGKFRVVATQDLAQFAYNGDRSRMESDVENLRRQGLVRETKLADMAHKPTRVVSLTKAGHNLLSRGKVVPHDQATYHDLKKPKEAFHDSDLYRLYHKVSDEIECKGGRVDRVILDYEIKEELYAKLADALQGKTRERERETIREEIAEEYHLKIVRGKIPIPDLRIEYADQELITQRRDLELATDHYRPRGLAEKARAGFQIYARSDEADRLQANPRRLGIERSDLQALTMHIPESQLAKLRAFGYTEVEARFLHIAATHSGYFTVGQFLSFAKASYGNRNARFVEKLLTLGHASVQRYRRNGRVYHLDSRSIYAAIGKDYLRCRRKHELRYIRTRLLGLDFILAHPDRELF